MRVRGCLYEARQRDLLQLAPQGRRALDLAQNSEKVEGKKMRNPCDGCAFKKGSEANEEPHNNLKGQLCSLGALPFYCHETIEWRDPASHRPKTRSELRELRRAGKYQICGGWQKEVNRLSRLGFFGTAFQRMVKRAYAITGLEALAIFSATDDAEDKRDARRQLADIIRAFVKAKRKLTETKSK
jgi:hypothetical protein